MTDYLYRTVGRDFTELNGAVNDTETSWVVADGTIFPLRGIVPCVIDSEIVWMLSRVGNNIEVLRGQEGTAAAAHDTATQLYPVVTKKLFDEFWGEHSAHTECRLSVVQDNPLPTVNSSGDTIYLEPYEGCRVSVMEPVQQEWRVFSLASGIPLDVSVATSGAADVFLYYDEVTDVLKLEAEPWIDSNTRAVNIERNKGQWVKSGDANKRYVGSFFSNDGSRVWDTDTQRHLYNLNSVPRRLYRDIPDNSWMISTALGPRPINATPQDVSIFVGQSGVNMLDLEASLTVYSTESSTSTKYMLGLSRSSNSFDSGIARISINRPNFGFTEAKAQRKETVPNLGFGKYWLVEEWVGTGDILVYGDNNEPSRVRSAIEGFIEL